jgi:hypothetical protein
MRQSLDESGGTASQGHPRKHLKGNKKLLKC